jgi:3-methyladenine DNA glycosylase/8-oxoguanine DNA glycosylase
LRRHAGVRLPGAACGFEAAVRAILGQQVSVAAATRLVTRLVDLCGEPLRLENFGFEDLRRVFPSPQAVASADLSRLPVPRARAARFKRRRLCADRIRCSRRARGIRAALSLRGVREWTAHYAALRASASDAFPPATWVCAAHSEPTVISPPPRASRASPSRGVMASLCCHHPLERGRRWTRAALK